MNTSTRTLIAGALLALMPALSHASYADHDEARAFIQDMAERHGFEAESLRQQLSKAERIDRVIRLIRPPSTPTDPEARSWERYRGNFLTDQRIQGGVRFWRRYAETIEAASREYNVPPEIIVSILGVETNYGSYTGNFEAVSALATLAFDYPPRADLFRRELENLFLLAREEGRDPFSYRGSYAGALGYPQFLPSSIRNYGVDFSGDGRIDFDSDPIDAIGSVANYFAEHGWRAGEPVAVQVHLPDGLDPQPLIDAGIEPSLQTSALTEMGVIPLFEDLRDDKVTLFNLPTPGQRTEYWLGYRNFYVITRYNRSSFYAMAVYELANAIRDSMPEQYVASE